MRDSYRTNDGKAIFQFRFVYVGSYYEIDIIESPSYADRASGPHDTHRLSSDRGGYRICVGDNYAVDSLSIARRVAAAWAEQSWRYIKTGRPFAGS